MTDVGLQATTASQVAAVMAISGMIGKIICGMLADRIGGKWTMAIFLTLQAVMIPMFINAHAVPTFFTWAVLFGLGYGGPMPVYAMLFREYFGTRFDRRNPRRVLYDRCGWHGLWWTYGWYDVRPLRELRNAVPYQYWHWTHLCFPRADVPLRESRTEMPSPQAVLQAS